MNDNSPEELLVEDKILILYVLQKVNKPISHKELLELIIAVSDINYFYFQQFLADLLDDHYILKQGDEIELYELTEEGKQALELTLDLIPGIIKFKIDSHFKESLDSIKDKFSISAEYTPLSEKDFVVTCRIIEEHVTIFKLETHVGSKEQAGKIVSNWNLQASEIYPKVLGILTE